ncbi:MAG: DegT/DnrJ/EryC1/StrS family aminotransferase [Spirochaetia bacterium]
MNHSTERGDEQSPVDSRNVPFARPSIGESEKEAVLRVLESGWLTTGEHAAAFEHEFAEAVGARHALAVSSATAGLHLALEAAEVEPGDRVAVSPYTFASSAEVIRYLGAEPLFVDIEDDSPNISPAALKETMRTAAGVSAVIPVHIAGLPCRMDAIREIADQHQLRVIEDAAHAFPTRFEDGSMVGSRGTAVFSFYANKPITTGEGGMITTDSPDCAARIRLMRLHGIDRTVWDRYTRPGASWEYDLVAPGYKYNLPDILAVIGRGQLARASRLHARRAEIVGEYLRALEHVPEVLLPRSTAGHAWHLFSIQIDAAVRDAVIDDLATRGIGTSVHYKPLHLMTYYQRRYGLTAADFPRASARYRQSVSLPLYPDMDSEDAHYVVESLKQVLSRRSAARMR